MTNQPEPRALTIPASCVRTPLPESDQTALFDPVERIFYPDGKWRTGDHKRLGLGEVGLIVGLYIRNSTAVQVGNDRSIFQYEMIPWLLRLGYAVKIYDEQGTSGRTLIKRKIAGQMFIDLENGVIHGIACADVTRLSRDEYGFDKPVIAKMIREFAVGGLLIIHGQEMDLRIPGNMQQFDIQSTASGWQIQGNKTALYQGLKVAASRRPIMRKKARLGYTHQPWIVDGVLQMGSGNRIKRVPAKDMSCEATMKALREVLHLAPELGMACRMLHERKVAAPWTPRSTRMGWVWKKDRLESILRDPLYCGKPSLMTSKPGPIWDSFMAVTPGFDPRSTLSHNIPELAWWTEAEQAGWVAKFNVKPWVAFETKTPTQAADAKAERAAGAPATRRGKHNHLLIGLLRCESCDAFLVKSGIDAKFGDPVYVCPGYMGRHGATCASPRFVSERVAWRWIDAEVAPALLDGAAEMARAIADNQARMATEEGLPSEAAAEIARLNTYEKDLYDGLPEGVKPSEVFKERIARLYAERAKHEAKLVQEHAARAQPMDEETLRRWAEIESDPYSKYVGKGRAVQAQFLRLLVKGITICTNGKRGFQRQEFSPVWEMILPSDFANAEPWAWLLLSQVGRLLAA